MMLCCMCVAVGRGWDGGYQKESRQQKTWVFQTTVFLFLSAIYIRGGGGVEGGGEERLRVELEVRKIG